MTLALVGESLKGVYPKTTLGDQGVDPSLACMTDLHMNCRGWHWRRMLGRSRADCTCECHVVVEGYR